MAALVFFGWSLTRYSCCSGCGSSLESRLGDTGLIYSQVLPEGIALKPACAPHGSSSAQLSRVPAQRLSPEEL